MSVSAFTAGVSLAQPRAEFLPVLRGHAERLGRLLQQGAPGSAVLWLRFSARGARTETGSCGLGESIA